MNKLPNVSCLQRAMTNVDLQGVMESRAAVEIGQEAIRTALEAHEPPPPAPIDEGQRQRDLDAALADSVEVVARQRARLGRKVCSRHDGETVRRVFELLRGMLENGADNDASFA